MAAPGAQPTGIYAEVAQIKDRARQQTELARQISRALHVRDIAGRDSEARLFEKSGRVGRGNWRGRGCRGIGIAATAAACRQRE